MKVWKPTNDEIQSTNNWNTWGKEASEFPWSYEETETCYILEGEAYVADNKDNKIKFGKGDMVRFFRGTDCVWTITKDLKKRYKFG
ncbi:MAG: cupin domain-containing protein [Bacteroidales bacterium]|nr:cupin domain-containing protein [Bacteroidales bacterium]